MVDYEDEMKKRSLAGNVGIAFLAIAFLLVAVAFSTSSWLVPDYHIKGGNLDRLGLWRHCFRSLQDPNYENRFFVGCRWVYDRFTTGYDQLKGLLLPHFFVATQFFFTLCFISVLLSTILTLLYFFCCKPDLKQFVLLNKLNAWILLAGGLSGGIAVIVFASCANRDHWMSGHDINFFGWSFALACVGAVACLVASCLFFVDGYIQLRKKDRLEQSRTRFEMEYGSRN